MQNDLTEIQPHCSFYIHMCVYVRTMYVCTYTQSRLILALASPTAFTNATLFRE